MINLLIQCEPDVILLGWCYSLNGDVSMLLRSEGVFSLMILNNDLRIITSNPLARLNDTQRQIIKETGRDVMLLQSHRYLSCQFCLARSKFSHFDLKSYFQSREMLRPVCLCGGVRGLGRP